LMEIVDEANGTRAQEGEGACASAGVGDPSGA
jgi:hypothetical protein